MNHAQQFLLAGAHFSCQPIRKDRREFLDDRKRSAELVRKMVDEAVGRLASASASFSPVQYFGSLGEHMWEI